MRTLILASLMPRTGMWSLSRKRRKRVRWTTLGVRMRRRNIGWLRGSLTL